MLMVPWAVVGATRTLAQSALPDAPQVHQRAASRRQRVHRITQAPQLRRKANQDRARSRWASSLTARGRC